MDRILDADAERQEQPIYQGFAVKGLPRLTGLPLEACLYVDRLEAGRAPELSVCASADYTHLKRQQLAVAAALRRCRHHKAGLSALVSSSAAALAEEDKKSQAHWEWAEPALLLCRLPPLSLQDALLEQNALGAAVRALQPAADGFDTSHSWRGLGSAVEEAQLAECTVLLSRTHTVRCTRAWQPRPTSSPDLLLTRLRSHAAAQRATPDAAGWRGWVVHVRHEAWRREAAVCVCLRKFAPPHGGEFSRLLCGATAEAVANAGAGGAGAGESQLVTEVEAAMERWPPPAGAGYQRAKLHSACEQLTWTREAARHFQVRPACAPLLRQAVQVQRGVKKRAPHPRPPDQAAAAAGGSKMHRTARPAPPPSPSPHRTLHRDHRHRTGGGKVPGHDANAPACYRGAKVALCGATEHLRRGSEPWPSAHGPHPTPRVPRPLTHAHAPRPRHTAQVPRGPPAATASDHARAPPLPHPGRGGALLARAVAAPRRGRARDDRGRQDRRGLEPRRCDAPSGSAIAAPAQLRVRRLPRRPSASPTPPSPPAPPSPTPSAPSPAPNRLANELPLERLLAVEADERCGHGGVPCRGLEPQTRPIRGVSLATCAFGRPSAPPPRHARVRSAPSPPRGSAAAARGADRVRARAAADRQHPRRRAAAAAARAGRGPQPVRAPRHPRQPRGRRAARYAGLRLELRTGRLALGLLRMRSTAICGGQCDFSTSRRRRAAASAVKSAASPRRTRRRSTTAATWRLAPPRVSTPPSVMAPPTHHPALCPKHGRCCSCWRQVAICNAQPPTPAGPRCTRASCSCCSSSPRAGPTRAWRCACSDSCSRRRRRRPGGTTGTRSWARRTLRPPGRGWWRAR